MEELPEGGYIEMDAEAQRSASIAEINLINAIDNMLRMLIEEVRTIYANIDKLRNSSEVEIDSLIKEVRNVKEEVERFKDDAMEYLARVPSGLIMKDIFGPIILGLNNANQLIEGSFYRLALLAKRGKAGEKLSGVTKDLLGLVMDQLEYLSKTIRIMSDYPKEAIEVVKKCGKAEDEIDKLYRSQLYDVLSEAKECPCAILAWEIVGNIEDASDVLKDVAENFRYYLLHKV
ncbi:hypothetical protein IPA_03610 [Ignicoccus pacificus DSM 13166]|uniref:DUF47 family protein n=1 Tax=Ignicoccus pacificus DSM 13166 TaxID=940294 RepID=A0A977KCH0_9CREN|nr:hypothetical protein IPA_03610 [Ignicoccus pacificus DSM 13166]